MNTWLYATRLTVAAFSVGRARRCFDLAVDYAAERRQFGQQIAKFQGVSFQVADMVTEIDAADWLTLAAAWRLDQGLPANREIASAKLYASEMLARVTDATLQIHGGMGLMDDLPRRTLLARCPRGTHLGRHQRDPAPHHRARDLPPQRRPEMQPLARLMRPRSIAVVGGGTWCAAVVAGCRAVGFAGPVWPVHPTRAEVAGVAAFPSVADLPDAPDAVFIGVNREASIEVLRALSATGAGGAVCFASGFRESVSETGDGPVALEAALVEARRAAGARCRGRRRILLRLPQALLARCRHFWPDQHGRERGYSERRTFNSLLTTSSLFCSSSLKLPLHPAATYHGTVRGHS